MKIKISLIILLSLSILAVNTVGQGTTGEGTIGEGTTGGADKVLDQPVPGYIIIKSDSYIKSFIGEDYFNTYLKRIDNITLDRDGKIVYIISYIYNIPEKYLERPHPKQVAVTLDKDGNIKDYLGPKKPYKFIMTTEKIIELAKENGLKGNIDAQIDRILDSGSIDGYVWVAESDVQTDCKTIAGGNQECMIPGIYLDIDNGSVIGRFNTSNLISNDRGGEVVTGTPIKTPTITEMPTETRKSPFISGFILILIFILAVILNRKVK